MVARRRPRRLSAAVGHSAGANAFAAWSIAKDLSARGETGCVVTILCDRGDRYFPKMKWERLYTW